MPSQALTFNTTDIGGSLLISSVDSLPVSFIIPRGNLQKIALVPNSSTAVLMPNIFTSFKHTFPNDKQKCIHKIMVACSELPLLAHKSKYGGHPEANVSKPQEDV